MTHISPEHLQLAADYGGLNPRFPDGHIALFLAIQPLDPTCVLHRYTLRLDNTSTTETSYGFALECNGVVWSLGNVVGWECIEENERQWGKQAFENWGGGPALSVVFLREVFDAGAVAISPYVQQKTCLLANFFRAHTI